MPGKIGLGLGGTIISSSSPAVTIDDYLWDLVSAGNLEPLASGTVSDFHDSWDLDGVDYMPEASPDDEGYWDDYTDIVTNGTFAVDANWTTGTGWDINTTTKKAECDGSQSSNTTLVQQQGILGVTLDIQVGNAYELTFTLVRSAGGITNTEVGGTTEGTTISSSGTHSKIITASSTNDRITFTATPDFVGSIDNVSLVEYAISPLDV